MICAERFGFTGTGGGGAGVSIVRRVRWRAFKVANSSFKAREFEVEFMAFEVGSMWMGRRVKDSGSSIVGNLKAQQGALLQEEI